MVALQSTAEAHWQSTDRTMAALSRANRLVPTRFWNPDPFAALVEAIVFQQVSLASGDAIMGRLRNGLSAVRPADVAAAGADMLRSFGLSRQKATYLLDLARHFEDGKLGPHAWAGVEDVEVVARLCAVQGIGPWTAKMFLMFHLQRPDVVCPEDLGLRQSYASVYGGTEKDAWRALADHAPRWSPYNTVAARVLWKARRNED